MTGKLRHISREYPDKVPVLIGSCIELVQKRELVNKYEVNRTIKYWATWYLLKSLTTTGFIQRWVSQKKYLLTYLQMNEPTFRFQLSWLKQKGLISIDKSTKSIRLTSYEHAAEIMGISFQGTYQIEYNYDTIIKYSRKTRPRPVKQSFQYILRAEEFERRKEFALRALMHKLEENPKIFADLVHLLVREGCDSSRLINDPVYFQQRFLQLQMRYFREGSDLLSYVFTYRADINRGVKKIKDHHGYRSAQSVSYLKKRMHRMGIVDIRKLTVISDARSRLFIPDRENGGMKEGYKWYKPSKVTALILCDQVFPRYRTDLSIYQTEEIRKTA